MDNRESAYRGCLLGLAVGDAMGYAVDGLSWDSIFRDYGPEGIRGYDLVNGYADVTSNTQIAAYGANGLMVGLTRGQMLGRMMMCRGAAEMLGAKFRLTVNGGKVL